MTPTQINHVVARLLTWRDEFPSAQRSERDLLADACNALDGYAKLQRAVDSLNGEHDIEDGGRPGEYPHQVPNWAMRATTFLEEHARS